MGANFEVVVLPGSASKAQVERRFQALRDEAGPALTPYDGTWATVSSVQVTDHACATVDDGEAYILEHADKWYSAVAVRVRGYAGEYGDARADGDGYVWLLGGLLAC